MRDGANFVNSDNIALTYDGLKNIVLYYVYFYYKADRISFSTETGEERAANINSTIATENMKMVRAWNELYDIYGTDYLNLFSKYQNISNTVKPFDLSNCYHSVGGVVQNTNRLSIMPTAYNFINTNILDYPNWIFLNIGNINRLGI